MEGLHCPSGQPSRAAPAGNGSRGGGGGDGSGGGLGGDLLDTPKFQLVPCLFALEKMKFGFLHNEPFDAAPQTDLSWSRCSSRQHLPARGQGAFVALSSGVARAYGVEEDM